MLRRAVGWSSRALKGSRRAARLQVWGDGVEGFGTARKKRRRSGVNTEALKKAIAREARQLFGDSGEGHIGWVEADDDEVFPGPKEGSPRIKAGACPPDDASAPLDHARQALRPGRPFYRLQDFTGLTGADLVRAAYGAVLRREPDADGFRHYVKALTSGRYTPVDVLGAIRYSPEGRRRGTPVRGLLVPFILSRLSRLPVVGVLWRLPLLGLRLRWMEAHLHRPAVREQEDAALEKRVQRLEALEARMASQESRTAAAQSRVDAVARQLTRLIQVLFPQFSGAQKDSADADALPNAVPLPVLAQRMIRLEERLQTALSGLQSVRRAVLDVDRRLNSLASPGSAEASFGQGGSAEPSRAPALSDLGYLLFEDAFRGDDDHVRQGQVIYMPLLQSTPASTELLPVLDLGCGRGQWLALLQEHGYRAVGVDCNEAAVHAARSAGLDVILGDAEKFLDEAPPQSFGAVTAFHLLEHLAPDRWPAMLSRIHRVLAPGGLAVLETPNPRHLLVGSGDFYRDPTHRHPVFPDTLAFLGEAAGFADSTAWFFNADRTRLIRCDAVAFDALQDYLNVSRDFAWTGRKPA